MLRLSLLVATAPRLDANLRPCFASLSERSEFRSDRFVTARKRQN
jgi:hypothetical protein